MIIDRVGKLGALLEDNSLDAIFITKESNVRYLSGYTNREAYLLITAQGRCCLFTDSRYDEIARQDCPDWEIFIFRKGQSDLFHTLAAACGQSGVKILGFEAEHLTVAMLNRVKEALPGVELREAPLLTEKLRYVKDPGEEECLRRACVATDRVFSRLCEYIRPGLTERQLEWELLTYINQEGCHSGFPPIVVSGERGSLPHGAASDKPLAPGEFITMDFGCMYQGYHADMTRTVLLGQPEAQQREIYDIVLEAHRRGAAEIKAQVPGSVPDAAARNYIAGRGYGDNFAHGLGHGVGLDIHEGLSMGPASDQVFQAGCFVTVEPGIYIPGWGGVRIEDVYKVLEDGCESLFTSTKELICL